MVISLSRPTLLTIYTIYIDLLYNYAFFNAVNTALALTIIGKGSFRVRNVVMKTNSLNSEHKKIIFAKAVTQQIRCCTNGVSILIHRL